MNLWIINHYSGNFSYGMEYRHFLLSRYLKKLGVSPIIISASYHHLYTSPPQTNKELTFEEHDGIPFCIVKTRPYEGNGLRRLLNTLQFSRKLNRNIDLIASRLGKPDVAIGSTPHPFVYFNLSKLKRKFDIPTAIEVRDLWPLMLYELGSLSRANPLAWLFAWIERKSFQNTDLTFSLWYSADQYMLKHGLKKEKYAYLPNGIELDSENGEMPKEETALIEDVKRIKAEGKFVVGYAGSHGYANPLDMIMDACCELRSRGNDRIVFYLVGDGPEKRRIVERANREGIANIRFFDYVSKATIMSFLKEIDVAFIGLKNLPLFKYGPTPNKLMDYLAAGKPIIFAINSSFDPVSLAGAGLSVKADDYRGLAEAATELSNRTQEELEHMGKAGRTYAERKLSFPSLAKELKAHLAKLISASECQDHQRSI